MKTKAWREILALATRSLAGDVSADGERAELATLAAVHGLSPIKAAWALDYACDYIADRAEEPTRRRPEPPDAELAGRATLAAALDLAEKAARGKRWDATTMRYVAPREARRPTPETEPPADADRQMRIEKRIAERLNEIARHLHEAEACVLTGLMYARALVRTLRQDAGRLDGLATALATLYGVEDE
jgi:hypothetical protein